jgi:hypothetical protein
MNVIKGIAIIDREGDDRIAVANSIEIEGHRFEKLGAIENETLRRRPK